MRVALGIEYDGTHYHGWQKQSGLHTVQSCVEQALTKLANEPIAVTCAGRTDTGVHATGQVIHFDTLAKRSIRAWIFGANSYLPKDISVHWAKLVNEDFHARFSARSRRYCYIIYNHTIAPAIFRSNLSWYYKTLDHERMAEAAQHLVGEHDFTSFRAMECQSKSPMRTIEKLTVTRKGRFVILDVTANAFLHHMVRNIAGVLMVIGSGKQPTDWTNTLLNAKNRSLGAETAPPYGLFLTEVIYPSQFDIPNDEALPGLLGMYG